MGASLKAAPRGADQSCVRGCIAALLVVGLLTPKSNALAADDPCRDRLYTGDLVALFVAPQELGSGWESVRETPSNPAEDPDLHAAGINATHSLHYTRAREAGSEVCSVEIWAFTTAAAARRARAEIEQPLWRFALRGNLLIALRGVTLSRGEGFRPGLLPECHSLADLTEAGASERLGCSGSKAWEGAD